MLSVAFFKLNLLFTRYLNVLIVLSVIVMWFLFKNVFNFTSEYSHSAVKSFDEPIIFIGGSYRSGTTLMRVMLDAHPQIRCGEETRIIPRFLEFITRNMETDKKLEGAGITKEILTVAANAFISSIVNLHGKLAPNLCTKDPENLRYSKFLAQLFPSSKFILLIRDARAVVNSIMTRGLSAGGYSPDYKRNFFNWNRLMEDMYSQCQSIGPDRCLPVYYEQLVLHIEKEMKNILSFLNIPWHKDVLQHEQLIGSEIKLAKVEMSSDQVVKPVNLEGLDSWFGNIPDEVLDKIDTYAPMLKKLGYDTKSKRPNYGEADQRIKDNTLHIQQNRQMFIDIAKNHSDDRFHKFFDRSV